MCNLYRMTGSAQAIAQLFATETGGSNLPAFPALYPEAQAPVIVARDGVRQLDMMQWGWPAFGEVKRPVTNVRNLASPFWRSALADPARRCLVPVSAFCEWSQAPDPLTRRKRQHWFALTDNSASAGGHGTETGDDPLFAFAGLWRPTAEGPRFAFLTCEANALVGRVHPKAMPVILRPGDDTDRWLNADGPTAAALQRPFPDTLMRELEHPATIASPVQGTLL
ncbi:SOS response-associated peptidase [Novosphingobium sp. FKTRR1]|uniref:SOS response-associated peptidase n=1 Tax=Novosphingobium sp. FKTRR1 TaxID=2879118 RepID=UPI001CF0ABEC|nr:SOS response-associated peptidase family protein [Novosphingobium sp. FKTRR1]